MPQVYGLLSRDQCMADRILDKNVTHCRIAFRQFRFFLILFPAAETAGNKPIRKKNQNSENDKP